MRVTQAYLRKQAANLRMDYSYSPVYGEHRVNLKTADGGTTDTAYYTDNAADARDTMVLMARDRDRAALRHTTAYHEVLSQVFGG